MPSTSNTPTATHSEPDTWKQSSCFSTSVRRADRALTRIYDEALRPSRLSTTQYSLLSLLARAPHRMSIGEIAEIQAMDRTTLTRDLNPLVREGLVEIAPAEHDRRVRMVSITPKGHETIDIARPLWKSAQDRIASEQGLARMEHLLDELGDLVSRVR
jgi:DNA-binding MarR family transcriptional regulator